MASLFKPVIVRYRLPDGRAVKKGTPGARKVSERTKHWYGKYRDENNEENRIPLCTDKEAARSMLRDLVRRAERLRAGLIDPTELHQIRPLIEHLDDFEADLKARENTSKHVRMTVRHVRFIIEHAKVERMAQLTGDAVSAAIGSLREAGRGLRTCNAHLRSAKSFTRWLWRNRRLPEDALSGLSAFNEATDRRHVRRELSTDEINWLLQETAKHTRPEHNLPGTDRAMAYRLALGTGLRARELRSLTPESFALNRVPPTVTLDAAYSKHRKQDTLPLRADLVAHLRDWLRGRKVGVPVLTGLPLDTARMLRSDLAASRKAWLDEATTDVDRNARERTDFLKYENAAGEKADFHSTRVSYISALVNGGASLKSAMTLARHSTARLTVDRYAKPRLHDLTVALEALPNLGPTAKPEPATQQSTGTDGPIDLNPASRSDDRRESVRFPVVPPVVPPGDFSGREASPTGTERTASTPRDTPAQDKAASVVDAACREVSVKRRRWESNPRWRICNPLP